MTRAAIPMGWIRTALIPAAAGACVALYPPRHTLCESKGGGWGFFGKRSIASHAPEASSIAKMPAIKMYQYEICPFCNKVKAVLDYHKIPYSTVEVNPLTKKEFKVTKELPEGHPAHGYRRVPIAAFGEEIVGDSPVILAKLVDEMATAGVINKQTHAEWKDPKVADWVKWCDSKLAVLLFPNLTRTYGDSYQAFGYVMDAPNFTMVDKMSNLMAGSLAMWLAQGKIKKKYAIEDEREALKECIGDWVKGLGEKSFMGGDQPNLADLAVFGTMRAVEGSPTQAFVMMETELAPWYERMMLQVGDRSNARTARLAE
eukprot:CAMPEP_0173393482 /NCGR_PEP_ID=MMETSP1356-20130122/22132_1 /TAXON_ID=77927 ORGANISM="Hemiselmis virescens, Strain PCC157" /NCGR_SAMPLE_ID=MMETSP1356 /ASSEMBLY_ACC=CAM_ASM_000847 /LENGTH=314 /DNA_ID=CAMNT_0014351503 /DNA_START=223 /DNA_END=1167 /DNA_ORIENTATION=+